MPNTESSPEVKRADVFALVRESGEIESVWWKREDAEARAKDGVGVTVAPVAVVDRLAVTRPDVRALRELVDGWRENAAELPENSPTEAAEASMYGKCARALRGLLDFRPQPDIRAFDEVGRRAADAIAHRAATVTLDAGLVEVVLAENARRLAVLARAEVVLARYAEETGGCDHSVNVCECELRGVLSDVRDLLRAVPR